MCMLIMSQGDTDKEQLFCMDMLTLFSAMSTLSDRLKSSELWQLYCELEVKIIPLLAGTVLTGLSYSYYYTDIVQ